MKSPRSYVINALLAGAALYFAQDLSRSDRGWIDWTVMGLIGLAILWNLVRLGRILYRSGGGKSLWHLQRTVLFWVGGLLDTGFAREGTADWRLVAGWGLLIVAAADSFALYNKEQAALRAPVADNY